MNSQSLTYQRQSNCPGCGSLTAKIYDQLSNGCYVRCLECDLVSIDPLLRPEALLQRAEHWAVEHHKKEAKVSQHYSSSFQKIAFGPHLKELKRYRQVGRLLDVGCGIGGFVAAAQSEGWQAYGIDVSSSLEVAQQHGLQVQKTTLENSSFQPSFFDVITSFDVIEHIPDPNTLLQKAYELLRPGGVIYLQTPNLAGLNARLLGARWESLEPDDHACLYSPNSLKNILSRHGFETVKVMTLDLNLVELRHIFQPARGETNRKQRQQERRQFIGRVMRSRWLQWGRQIANGGLSLLGWGDKLVVEAQKRG